MCALGAVSSALAFSLLGPYKAWQATGIGYQRTGDIGGPMTPGESYRWNIPVITYAFDQSFINYFGTNGIRAVEQAISTIGDLPLFSHITNDGSNLYINGEIVPREVTRRNYLLEAVGGMDLKSSALSLLLEELGLAEPERWIWALRLRATYTQGGQTFTNYVVANYNYDPITLRPSSYINGTLYRYQVIEPIAPDDHADAFEDPVDDLAFTYTSVAGKNLLPGQYFIGLSHDDVGGLKYLYSFDNIAGELLPTNAVRQPPSLGPWTPYFGGPNSSNLLLNTTNVLGVQINTNATNLLVVEGFRPGLEKLQFQRVNYDSLLGQTFFPITNRYNDAYLSNSILRIQPVARVITQPDLLFVATDLGYSAPPVPEPYLADRTATASWQNNDLLNGNTTAGGPGVVTPPIVIAFTDQLPVWLEETPGGESTLTSFLASGWVWASFDGTTNAPVIYPTYGNLTLTDLQNIVFGRVR
jgi:hypothetical protein